MMEPHRVSKVKWKFPRSQLLICGLLLSAFLASFLELSYSSPADATVTIDTGTTVVTNALQLGNQVDRGDVSYWRGSSTARKYSQDANFKMVRVFYHVLGNPCTYWNEGSQTGTWSWGAFDDLITKIIEIGAEPLIVLGYASWTSDQINGLPRGMTVNWSGTGLPNPDQWDDYTADWVQHFGDVGLDVNYYEILNEPQAYFGSGGSNSARREYFKDFFNQAAVAMRAIDASIKIGNDNSMVQSNGLNTWMAQNLEDLDFLSWHPYLTRSIYASDSYLISKAQYDEGGTYGANDFIDPARQDYYDEKDRWLPVIASEGGLSSAWSGGSDSRIQAMLGAVCEALRLRLYVLNGNVDYNIFFVFSSSRSWEEANKAHGWGFGMVNKDDNTRWYPYYTNYMVGGLGQLEVGDSVVSSSSSLSDIVPLAWVHGGSNNILLINTVTSSRTVQLSGVSGTYDWWRIDNSQDQTLQSGSVDVADELTFNGYTVMLLRGQNADEPPNPPDENPSSSDIGYNTTIAGNGVEFFANWTDDNGLSGYIFGTNNTGTWINDTWASLSGTQDWANVSKTLNSTSGVTVQFRWWANDTADQWFHTFIQSIVTDPQNIPQYSNAWADTNYAGENATFTVDWRDIEGLSGYIFGTNNTGTWVNETWVDPWVGNPTSGVSETTKNLTGGVSTKVEWRVWCNDTGNNWGDAGGIFVIAEQEYTLNLLFFDSYGVFLYNTFLEDNSFPFLEDSNGTVTDLNFNDATGYFYLKINSESVSYTYLRTNGKGQPYSVTGVTSYIYDAIRDRLTLTAQHNSETEVGVLWRAEPSLYAYNATWIPNPTWIGGLNTEITFGRFFLFERVTLQNQSFIASVNGSDYWLYVVNGSNVKLTLHNWFDSFGTAFTVDRACTMNLFVNDNGQPSKVIGASYTWYTGNNTLKLTTTGASYVGIHWNTGATVRLANPDQTGFYHSQDNLQGNQSVYGFGITKAGHNQYGFQTRVYCRNGEDGIDTVALELGNSITYTYDRVTNRVTQTDPSDYTEIAEEWYAQNQASSWVKYDSDTQYLDVGFYLHFKQFSRNESYPHYWFPKYQPYLVNQYANVTVNSQIEGSVSNYMPAVFYVGTVSLPFPEPIAVPWDPCFMMIGLGGILCLVFAITRRARFHIPVLDFDIRDWMKHNFRESLSKLGGRPGSNSASYCPCRSSVLPECILSYRLAL